MLQNQSILPVVLPAEITEFQYSCVWIKQKVLWFDVSVADAKTVNVSEAAK